MCSTHINLQGELCQKEKGLVRKRTRSIKIGINAHQKKNSKKKMAVISTQKSTYTVPMQ